MKSFIIKSYSLNFNLLFVSGWNFKIQNISYSLKRNSLLMKLVYLNLQKSLLVNNLFNINLFLYFWNFLIIYPVNSFDYSFYFFNMQKKHILFFFNNLCKMFDKVISNNLYNWFCNIYLIGLGFRIFIYKDDMFIRLGYSKIIKFKIPLDILVLSRKRNNLKCFSSNKDSLSRFVNFICSLRAYNKYKGKGIYIYSNYSFIKMKTGKRQQFF